MVWAGGFCGAVWAVVTVITSASSKDVNFASLFFLCHCIIFTLGSDVTAWICS